MLFSGVLTGSIYFAWPLCNDGLPRI